MCYGGNLSWDVIGIVNEILIDIVNIEIGNFKILDSSRLSDFWQLPTTIMVSLVPY